MTGKIITIKCPQCGSTEHTELRKNFYSCKSCSTQYVFDEDEPINQPFNSSTGNDYTKTSFGNVKTSELNDIFSRFDSTTINKAKRKLSIVIVLIVLAVLVPIIIGVISASRSLSSKSVIGSITKNYVIMGSETYVLASTTKKDPLVIRLENRYNTGGGNGNSNGEIYFVFFDPTSGEIIKDGKVTDASRGIPQFEFNTFSNGKNYVIIDDGQLYEINTDNLTLTEQNNRISKSTPELNSGIATIKFLSNENGDGYRIFNNNGKYYNYYPTINKIYTDDALEIAKTSYSPSDNVFKDDFYVTFGENSTDGEERSELLKINYKKYSGGPEYLEQTPRKYKGDNEYLHRRDSRNRITSINVIAQDRLFFEPKVLYFDNENIIITFKPSANPKAKFSIQKIDPKTNTVKWTLPNQETSYDSRAVKIKNGFLLKTEYNTFLGISSEGKELFKFKPEN